MRKSRKTERKKLPKRPMREKLSSVVDMPLETVYSLSQIQILENREVVVEGCKGILEYDDSMIRIRTKEMKVSFWGQDLMLKCFNTDNIIISGQLERVEFSL